MAACLCSLASLIAPMDDGTPPLICPFGEISSEVESAHVTRGKIRSITPVWNIDASLGAEIKDCGYVLAGVWIESDLSLHYSEIRDWYFNQIDPLASYGYEWKICEGWSLDSRVGLQWNAMTGYYGERRRSYDEYQWRESLKTPFVTVSWFMRTFYYPYYATAFKVGAKRKFPICGGLSFAPSVWLDGGTKHWNARRFGQYTLDKADYSRGFNSGSLQLFLTYTFDNGIVLYGGITEYVLIDSTARRQTRANDADEAKLDLLIGTMGVKYAF